MPLHNTGQLELELEALMEEPLFHSFIHKDVNRLSGNVKFRRVSAPNKAMRKIHLQIRAALSRLDVEMPYVTAGLRKSKVVNHVKAHRGNQYLCCYDLKAAYDHVRPEAMADILRQHGLPESDIELVARYCFGNESGGLVTGGLVSVQLFNLYANEVIDQPLATLFAERGGITYTRYIDDLIISSGAPIGRRFRRSILQIIRAAGFEIKPAKTQLIDLAAEHSQMAVLNGIGLDLNGELHVRPHYRELLYRLIKRAQAGEIDPSVVHGCMGAFYVIKPRGQQMTPGERKLDRAYRWYVNQQRRADPGRPERRRRKQQQYRARRRLKPSYKRHGRRSGPVGTYRPRPTF